MTIKKTSRKVLIGIFFILTFHFVNNYFWLSGDSLSLQKDVVGHLNKQFDLFINFKSILHLNNTIVSKLKSSIELIRAIFYHPYWPPLYHLSVLFVSLLSGHNLLALRLFPNFVYFVILILSIYNIGRKYKSAEVGFWAAFIVSFFPGIFGSSRIFGLDFSLAAMVSLTIWILLLTDGFSKRWYSILLGLSLSAALLIKPQGILFIIGPFLYILLVLYLNKEYRINKLLNIFIFLLILTIVTIAWYGRSLHILIPQFMAYMSGNMITPAVMESGPLTLNWFIFYLFVIVNSLSIPYFIVFIISFYMLFRKVNNRDVFILLIWIIMPYCILTILSLKDESYFLPAVPAFALIISLAIAGLSAKLRKMIYLFLVSISLFTFMVLSYWQIDIAKTGAKVLPFIIIRPSIVHSPQQDNQSGVARQIALLLRNNPSHKDNIKIGIIETEYFCGDQALELGYFIRLYCPNVKVSLSCNGGWPFFIKRQFLSDLSDFDYIIAFNKNSSSLDPDFSALDHFRLSKNSKPEFIKLKIRQFSSYLSGRYSIINRFFISPRVIPVYLLSKRPVKAASIFIKAPQQKIKWQIAKVISAEPLRSRLLLRYYDDQLAKEMQNYFYVQIGITTYENVFYLSDVLCGDNVVIDYFSSIKGKYIIRHLNVNNILDVPYFNDEEVSGNIRVKSSENASD